MSAATALGLLLAPLAALASPQLPVFPEPAEIDRIEVVSGEAIRSRERIAEIAGALRGIRGGWRRPVGTSPTPQATLSLATSDGQRACVVWLGPNWLSSRCGLPESDRPLIVDLSREQARFFRDVAGASWEIK